MARPRPLLRRPPCSAEPQECMCFVLVHLCLCVSIFERCVFRVFLSLLRAAVCTKRSVCTDNPYSQCHGSCLLMTARMDRAEAANRFCCRNRASGKPHELLTIVTTNIHVHRQQQKQHTYTTQAMDSQCFGDDGWAL